MRFLILGHQRRWLVWTAVTRNPTAEWLARQITEAFPWHTHRNISFATMTEDLAVCSKLASEPWGSGTAPRRSAHLAERIC